jgi:putative heme transporter
LGKGSGGRPSDRRSVGERECSGVVSGDRAHNHDVSPAEHFDLGTNSALHLPTQGHLRGERERHRQSWYDQHVSEPRAETGTAHAEAPWRRRFVKAWPWLKYIVGLGLGALAIWALAGRSGELSGTTHYLADVDWAWLVVAIAAEAASLVAFGMIQKKLLEAGLVPMGVFKVSAITFAVTAISNSMPAGPVLSSVFAFRQYEHQGADEAFAGWTLAALFVVAAISLSLVAAAGLAVAGAEGAGFDLVWVTLGVLVLAVAMGVLFLQRRALIWLGRQSFRAVRRVLHWPGQNTARRLETVAERLLMVKVTPRLAIVVTAWALANWLLDCSCLALSFVALGFGVPWKALLLAYGAGQLAVNLPITPGGLGVVEGSLTIALVIFGGVETQTVAAVLLYRIISFWGELPVGWAAWAGITWRNRVLARQQALGASERGEREGEAKEGLQALVAHPTSAHSRGAEAR